MTVELERAQIKISAQTDFKSDGLAYLVSILNTRSLHKLLRDVLAITTNPPLFPTPTPKSSSLFAWPPYTSFSRPRSRPFLEPFRLSFIVVVVRQVRTTPQTPLFPGVFDFPQRFYADPSIKASPRETTVVVKGHNSRPTHNLNVLTFCCDTGPRRTNSEAEIAFERESVKSHSAK